MIAFFDLIEFATFFNLKGTVMKPSLIGAGLLIGFYVVGAAVAADGKDVYIKNCSVCHSAMQPKLGDKKAWESLVGKGVDALAASVIKGKGAMPPKGGKPALTEDDIKASVEYMISQAK